MTNTNRHSETRKGCGNFNRILAIILSLVMLFSILPLTAYAQENPDAIAQSEKVSSRHDYADAIERDDNEAFYFDQDGKPIVNEEGGVFADPTDDQLREAGWSVTRADDLEDSDLAATGADGELAESGLSGAGTVSNPYLISSWEDFESVMKSSGAVVARVTKDIKLAYDWDNNVAEKPIKVEGNVTLDLNGHTVEKYYDDQWGSNAIDFHGSDSANRILEVTGTLTIEDNSGDVGMLRTYEYIDTDTEGHADCAGNQGYPVVVKDGGEFYMYGGEIAAGRKKSDYLVWGFLSDDGRWFQYGGAFSTDTMLSSTDVYYRNNGTALTLESGASATIYDGEFTGWGWEANHWGWSAYDNHITGIGNMHAAVKADEGSELLVYDGYFRGDCANIFDAKKSDVTVYTGYFRPTHSDYTVVGGLWDYWETAWIGYWRVVWDTKEEYGQLGLPLSAFDYGYEHGAALHYYTYDDGAVIEDYDPDRWDQWYEHDLEFGPVSPYGDLSVYYSEMAPGDDGYVSWTPSDQGAVFATGFERYFQDALGNRTPGWGSSEDVTYCWTITDTSYYNPGVSGQQEGGYDYATRTTGSAFYFLDLYNHPDWFDKTSGFSFTKGHTYKVECYVRYIYQAREAAFDVRSETAEAPYELRYDEKPAELSDVSIITVYPTFKRVQDKYGIYRDEYYVRYNMSKLAGTTTTLGINVNNYEFINGSRYDRVTPVVDDNGAPYQITVSNTGTSGFYFVDCRNRIRDEDDWNSPSADNRFSLAVTMTDSAGRKYTYTTEAKRFPMCAWMTMNIDYYTSKDPNFVNHETSIHMSVQSFINNTFTFYSNRKPIEGVTDSIEWQRLDGKRATVVSRDLNSFTADRPGRYRYKRNFNNGWEPVYSNVIELKVVGDPDPDADGSGTVCGTETSYLSDSETVTVQLLQNDTVKYSATTTGNSGTYSIPNVAKGSYTLRVSKKNHVDRDYEINVSGNTTQDVKICPIGDVTGDGKVTNADYSRVNQHVCKTKLLTDYALLVGDVVGSKGVTNADLARINQHVCKTKPLW